MWRAPLRASESRLGGRVGEGVFLQQARVYGAIANVAIKARVEPIHGLIYAGAQTQLARIRGRVQLLRQVFEDRRGFRQDEISVLQRRKHTGWD